MTSPTPSLPPFAGSHDGTGAGDHDTAYTFGRRPRLAAPYPFTTRQYARLLALRGSVRDSLRGADDLHQEEQRPRGAERD